ncbi:MAG: hypothetical protein CL678_02625 [Bdellovibrionaceae bacterium]|nr:hypothetical protein [Pseudobdellovibrionaceae bacterium]|tara:strand:+ start:204 stop:1988 length:1785 start_codon:yes stop_codon:yes gene_type:complete
MGIFNKLGLRSKVLFSVAISCLICGTLATGVAIYFNEKEFKEGLIEKARTLHGRINVAGEYVAQQGGLKPMIKIFTDKYTSSDQLTKDDKETILKQVPIYAAMVIGSEKAKEQNYEFRVFSDEPRNPKNEATPEEMKVFNKFKNDSNLKEFVLNKDNEVTVYRPVRIKKAHACLTCHGNPSQSPWGNGKDILGFDMENWNDGKLHGVFAITSRVDEVKAAAALAGKSSSTPKVVLFIVLGGILGLLFSAFIIRGPVGRLQSVVHGLSVTKDQIGEASNQVQQTSEKMSRSSSEQASSLQETVSSIDEISSMVQKNADSAQSSTQHSSEASQAAVKGKQTVDRMLTSIREVSTSNESVVSEVNKNNEKITEIVSVISNIGEKTKVINDIVFQTKLLSFNASVEAARAGEHGKGFAVVAEEVGNLASMSGKAALEITEMLDSSIKQVTEIVESSKARMQVLLTEGEEKISVGMKTAEECGERLEEILESVNTVNQMVQEIASASSEQASGVKEITKAMQMLDTITHENSSLSSDSLLTAETLQEKSADLFKVIAEINVAINGGTFVDHPSDNIVNFEDYTDQNNSDEEFAKKASGE